MALAEDVYALTRRFSRDELYGLTSQMNRAAVSIASSIAEGYGRGGRDYERFVGLAYGSLLEVETQIELAERVGVAPLGTAASVLQRTASVGRMLNALRKGLKRSRSRPSSNDPAP